MKKWFLLFALAAFGALPVAADEVAPGEYNVVVVNQKAPAATADYEVIMLTFWYNTPPTAATTETFGIKAGAPFGVGAPVYGLEASVLGSLTDNVDGVQTSLIMTMGKKVTGLQFAIVNLVDDLSGLQLGVFNYAKHTSFQVGILNYIADAPIPLLPVLNFKF